VPAQARRRDQLDKPVDNLTPQSPIAKNGALSRLFFLFCFYETPKNGVSLSLNAVWNECKAWFQTDRRIYKKPKKNLKTHNNQTRER
jgi:hypothetical protein